MRALRAVAFPALALAIGACTDVPIEDADSIEKSGPYLPGEQQPTVDLSRNPLAIYPPGVGQILAQTFSPTRRQEWGYFEIPVACADGVLLNFKIRDGLNGPILYEANVFGLTGSVDGVFDLIQNFDPAVSDGIKIKKDREYAIELSAFPGPTAVEQTCGIAQGPAGNSYARGQGYYQDPINGPDFLPLPTGAAGDDEDLPFRTLVR
jgi:hypothetical protein